MAAGDRERWDERWAAAAHATGAAPAWLDGLPEGLIPRSGRALDVASGSGRVALWLARRGLDVVASDVSPVGLARAAQAAAAEGLRLATRACDLEESPLPEGPWRVISCVQYLQRSLFPAFVSALESGGVLVCEVATLRNLERHARPSARFLIDEGELPALCAPLEPVWSREGWHDDHALARIVARKL